MTRRPDRRKPRTRQVLRDAFIALILERGYDTITVQDIVERANLGRATFYLHFKNKEQLLMSGLLEMFDDLKARVMARPASSLLNDIPISTIPFQHAFEYRDLYRVMLLNPEGTGAILNSIRNYVAQALSERIQQVTQGRQPLVPLEALTHYLAGALFSLLAWWLSVETPHTVEEMAALFQRLTQPVMREAFGIGEHERFREAT